MRQVVIVIALCFVWGLFISGCARRHVGTWSFLHDKGTLVTGTWKHGGGKTPEMYSADWMDYVSDTNRSGHLTVWWHANTNKFIDLKIRNGKPDRQVLMWYPTGESLSAGTITNGQPLPDYRWWDTSGKEMSPEEFWDVTLEVRVIETKPTCWARVFGSSNEPSLPRMPAGAYCGFMVDLNKSENTNENTIVFDRGALSGGTFVFVKKDHKLLINKEDTIIELKPSQYSKTWEEWSSRSSPYTYTASASYWHNRLWTINVTEWNMKGEIVWMAQYVVVPDTERWYRAYSEHFWIRKLIDNRPTNASR